MNWQDISLLQVMERIAKLGLLLPRMAASGEKAFGCCRARCAGGRWSSGWKSEVPPLPCYSHSPHKHLRPIPNWPGGVPLLYPFTPAVLLPGRIMGLRAAGLRWAGPDARGDRSWPGTLASLGLHGPNSHPFALFPSAIFARRSIRNHALNEPAIRSHIITNVIQPR